MTIESSNRNRNKYQRKCLYNLCTSMGSEYLLSIPLFVYPDKHPVCIRDLIKFDQVWGIFCTNHLKERKFEWDLTLEEIWTYPKWARSICQLTSEAWTNVVYELFGRERKMFKKKSISVEL